MNNWSEHIYGEVKVIQNSRYKWGVEDLLGNIIVPYGKYEWIDGFDQGLARVRTMGRTTNTKNISALFSFSDDSDNVEVTTDGDEILEKVLEERNKRPETFAKWGIINENGEEVLPVEYDEIWKFFGKNRSSTKVVKDGVAREVYFYELNPKLHHHIGEQAPSNSYHNREHHHQRYGQSDLREETWWAMTDGMYGDYPGHVDDYDFLGF